jgi:hypothetical protein
MPILLAGTIEFVHIEQVSALFTFCFGKVFSVQEFMEHNLRHAGKMKEENFRYDKATEQSHVLAK